MSFKVRRLPGEPIVIVALQDAGELTPPHLPQLVADAVIAACSEVSGHIYRIMDLRAITRHPERIAEFTDQEMLALPGTASDPRIVTLIVLGHAVPSNEDAAHLLELFDAFSAGVYHTVQDAVAHARDLAARERGAPTPGSDVTL